MVDTGGIVFDDNEELAKKVRHQALLAIDESDLILFLVDAQTGTTDIDKAIAKLLYPHRDKVLLVANKVDNEKYEWELYDFLQLGLGEPFPVSAIQSRNIGNFLDEVLKLIPETQSISENQESGPTRIAVVGKPNVGKSSIVNLLLGKERQIVTDIPGTTRDSVDSYFRYYGKEYVLVDTAGLRRKTKVDYGVEYFSVMRAIEAVDRSDVVVLVLAADEEISEQEVKNCLLCSQKNERDYSCF